MSDSTPLRVDRWVRYEDAPASAEEIGGLGGWFGVGDRWDTFIRGFNPDVAAHYEALRSDIVSRNIWKAGDWHQDEGTPVFSDGWVGSFSFRAWGDLMAAIWSTELDRDFCYMDFYYLETPSRDGRRECKHCQASGLGRHRPKDRESK